MGKKGRIRVTVTPIEDPVDFLIQNLRGRLTPHDRPLGQGQSRSASRRAPSTSSSPDMGRSDSGPPGPSERRPSSPREEGGGSEGHLLDHQVGELVEGGVPGVGLRRERAEDPGSSGPDDEPEETLPRITGPTSKLRDRRLRKIREEYRVTSALLFQASQVITRILRQRERRQESEAAETAEASAPPYATSPSP